MGISVSDLFGVTSPPQRIASSLAVGYGFLPRIYLEVPSRRITFASVLRRAVRKIIVQLAFLTLIKGGGVAVG